MIFPNPFRFLKALGVHVWEWVCRRPVLVPEEVYVGRLHTCKSCTAYVRGQCRACSCVVAVKAQLSREKCPKGFWGTFSGWSRK